MCFFRSEPRLSLTNFHDALRFELIYSINLAYQLKPKCLREVAERPVDVSRVRIDVPCTSAPRGIPAPDTHGVSKRCSKHAKGHVLPSRNT